MPDSPRDDREMFLASQLESEMRWRGEHVDEINELRSVLTRVEAERATLAQLLTEALDDDDQDGYRLRPDLEADIRGALKLASLSSLEDT